MCFLPAGVLLWVVVDAADEKTQGKHAVFGKKVYLCGKFNVMPQISSFYGIVIFMNFTDHSPAHFHAWYGEYKVTVGIRDGIVTGKMPGRALRMILEWLELHREELLADWEKAQNGSTLDKIEPLN